MGRPRIDIFLPRVPFTTADLKAQNPHVSAFVIQRNLEEWLANDAVRRTGSKRENGRLKAFYIYEAVAK